MTIVWVILAVVIALILLWLWAIAPHLPRADFSAFAKYDYAHRGLHDKERACRKIPCWLLTWRAGAASAWNWICS